MDSKTAKVVDKALIRIEKEFAKLKLLMADVRADIKKHYAKEKKKQ